MYSAALHCIVLVCIALICTCIQTVMKRTKKEKGERERKKRRKIHPAANQYSIISSHSMNDDTSGITESQMFTTKSNGKPQS